VHPFECVRLFSEQDVRLSGREAAVDQVLHQLQPTGPAARDDEAVALPPNPLKTSSTSSHTPDLLEKAFQDAAWR
jgi:hypothetical protein